MIDIGERKSLQFSTDVFRLLQRAVDVASKSREDSEKCRNEAALSPDELRTQFASMVEFYRAPETDPTPLDLNDEICEALLGLETLKSQIEKLITGNQRLDHFKEELKTLQQKIATITQGRIGVNSNVPSLESRIQGLLHRAGQKLEDWLTGPDLQRTAHYQEWVDKYHLPELRVIKQNIFRLLMSQTLELSNLKGSSVVTCANDLIIKRC